MNANYSEYSGYIYLMAGVLFFLAVKWLSDLKEANKAVFFSYEPERYHRTRTPIKRSELIQAVSDVQTANNLRFVTDGLPCKVHDVAEVLGRKTGKSKAIEEVAHLLENADGITMFHDLLITNPEEMGEQVAAKLVYEDGVKSGIYKIVPKRKEFLKKNSITLGTSLPSSGKRSTVITFSGRQLDSIRYKMRLFYPRNAALLFLYGSNLLKCINAGDN